MKNNSTLYIGKTGSLYVKFKDMTPGSNVFRLVPVWPIENEMLGQDWFEKEIASGNVRQLIGFEDLPDHKSIF